MVTVGTVSVPAMTGALGITPMGTTAEEDELIAAFGAVDFLLLQENIVKANMQRIILDANGKFIFRI